MEDLEQKITTPEQEAATTGSLDTPETSVIDTGSLEQTAIDPNSAPGQIPPPKKKSWLSWLLGRFNVYLLLFIVLLLLAAGTVAAAFVLNHRTAKNTLQTQSLSESTLKQLANSDVTVGDPKQVLNVQSNAVFAGKVLIRDSLEVAGPIQVGGSLTIPGITVSGSSVFDQVQVNKTLSVAGDAAFQGQLAVQKSLSVAGGSTFGGAISTPQLTTNALFLNGDLNLTHHIAVGGATPGRSNGSALGSGGTTSVGGSDTAGSININTGSAAAAGCFVTVNFSQKYNATPHVLVTPIGSAAANVGYYVNRTTTSFSVCAANTPPSNASFGFDYFVLD